MGNGSYGSVHHHYLTASFFSFPCSTMRSLPWKTALQELPRKSFSQAAILSKLFQCGSIPQNAFLQEQPVPVWVSHRVTTPARKLTPLCATLFTGPQHLAGACSSTDFSMGLQLPSGTSPVGLHSPQGNSLPHHRLHYKLQRKFCFGTWNTSIFFSDFGNSRALTHSHSSLLWPQLLLHNNFFLLFNRLSQRLMMGMVSAINETVLDLSGIGSIRHGGIFYQLFTEVIPVALLQIHR